MGEKDMSEKILEDYNDVFSDIVNVLLFHGQELIEPSALESQYPWQPPYRGFVTLFMNRNTALINT